MKFCVRCGAAFPAGAEDEVAFCPECGAAVPKPAGDASTKVAASSKRATASKQAVVQAPAAVAEQAAPAPAPEAPSAPSAPVDRDPAPRPPRSSSALLWVAWTLVVLLAAGNIFQGLYFGVFRDDAKDSQQATVTSDTTAVSLDVTVAPTTDTVAPAGGSDVSEATAKQLLRNAVVDIESAYIDLRTYDPSVMTPEYLQALDPTIMFMPDYEGADTVSAYAADSAVQYYGADTLYGLATVSASGDVYVIIYDDETGYQTYVNGEMGDW